MRSIIILSIIALGNTYCYGQTDTSLTTVSKKSTLTIGAVYTDNASYYGQKAVEKTPYVALAASYRLKSGIYFTGQTCKLLEEKTSSASAAALGAGVNFLLGNKLSADLSFSHSFYPTYSPLLQAGNTENASASLSHDGWLKSTVGFDYAFGKSSDAFVTVGLSKSINLFSIGKADIVSIAPALDVVGGTQRYYETYVTSKTTRDSVLGLPVPIFGGSTTHNDSTQTAATEFNVLSYNFKLPLAYSRAHYTVEAAYQLSLLSERVQANPGKLNRFFTLSFYYQF